MCTAWAPCEITKGASRLTAQAGGEGASKGELAHKAWLPPLGLWLCLAIVLAPRIPSAKSSSSRWSGARMRSNRWAHALSVKGPASCQHYRHELSHVALWSSTIVMFTSSAGLLANESCCSNQGDHPKTVITVTRNYTILHYVKAQCTSM